jgi:hypothetical protein
VGGVPELAGGRCAHEAEAREHRQVRTTTRDSCLLDCNNFRYCVVCMCVCCAVLGCGLCECAACVAVLTGADRRCCGRQAKGAGPREGLWRVVLRVRVHGDEPLSLYSGLPRGDAHGPHARHCVSERCARETAARLCRRLLRSSVRRFQILAGLSHMHKHGFFHRDIKPENLCVPRGQASARRVAARV